MAHIIVVGNEKGGSGKSTTSMHVATALARMGHRVGALDLDVRQRSFGRYLENRAHFAAREGLDLPMPRLGMLDPEQPDPLSQAMAELEPDCDFILLDCPGSHTRLSQMAHSLADTLITPMNDSFIDFDLLARLSPEGKILGPSIYAEMVWSARQMRGQAGAGPIVVNTHYLGDRIADHLAGQVCGQIGDEVEAPLRDQAVKRLVHPLRDEGPQAFQPGAGDFLGRHLVVGVHLLLGLPCAAAAYAGIFALLSKT